MTGLEFLSATIGQVVWPVFIIIVVIMLRNPIRQMISSPNLRRLKAGPSGFEMEFERELQKAENELTEAATETPKALPKAAGDGRVARDFIDEMSELADVLPRAVVLESHSKLERLLRNSVDTSPNGHGRPRYISMRTLTRAAVEQQLLSKSEAVVLNELTDLRNRVAHEPDETISRDAAMRYAELAVQVAIAVRLALGQTALDGPPL